MDQPVSASSLSAPTAEPATIRREDYRVPDWLVPHVGLDFALSLDAARVVSTLTVTRNPAGSRGPLRLDGSGLTADSVTIDGLPSNAWRMDGGDLVIDLAGDEHSLVIATTVNPSANTQLSGLYASNGMLCTQCEAEGFRRIAFFPDRPDVLSTYTVKLTGDKAAFPVLLANGNPVAAGEGADGAHWAQWDDPWPKPSYLFALVAGDLVANRGSFTTMGGRKVDLAIWVRAEDLARTDHAMASLKASMKWDEEAFGREYDLDVFNLVAVSDFNAGAMENKGLNIFNTKYVLADPETATDDDYDAIEAVIGHEYFHNWSGDRVTCRDWFQLSLKEGFTVLRDQLFSADMGSEPVKRIADVRMLRAAQFPEDSGPLAHPIRPDSYQEISNFYTATVYNKGAEVIRMMRTMAGPERFRAGTDLYFARHDGEAATCEDFVKAIEDGARLDHAGDVATLSLEQVVPATPDQPDKLPMPVPLRVALFDRKTGKHHGEQLVTLNEAKAQFSFPGYADAPVLSLNRGFSAPVAIDAPLTREDLLFLAEHDDDPFARYEAMQQLVVRHLVELIAGTSNAAAQQAGQAAIGDALGKVLTDTSLDDLMRGELLMLPGEGYLAEQFLVADPGAIHTAREALKAWLGIHLRDQFVALHDRACGVPYGRDAAARGARKVKTQALVYLAAATPAEAARRAAAQYDGAQTMTDRQGALMVLCGLDTPERGRALADFHDRFAGNPLVIDKWFSLQASSLNPQAIEHVRALASHPDFTLANPNRVRSLYMAFAANPSAFGDPSGAGYRIIADLILALDPLNGSTAARFVTPLGRWRRLEPGRSALMKAELERLAAVSTLSRDTREQVTRSLG